MLLVNNFNLTSSAPTTTDPAFNFFQPPPPAADANRRVAFDEPLSEQAEEAMLLHGASNPDPPAVSAQQLMNFHRARRLADVAGQDVVQLDTKKRVPEEKELSAAEALIEMKAIVDVDQPWAGEHPKHPPVGAAALLSADEVTQQVQITNEEYRWNKTSSAKYRAQFSTRYAALMLHCNLSPWPKDCSHYSMELLGQFMIRIGAAKQSRCANVSHIKSFISAAAPLSHEAKVAYSNVFRMFLRLKAPVLKRVGFRLSHMLVMLLNIESKYKLRVGAASTSRGCPIVHFFAFVQACWWGHLRFDDAGSTRRLCNGDEFVEYTVYSAKNDQSGGQRDGFLLGCCCSYSPVVGVGLCQICPVHCIPTEKWALIRQWDISRLRRAFRELCEHAGMCVEVAEMEASAAIGTHSIRVGSIQSAYEGGVAEHELQLMARHKDIATTRGYIDLPREAFPRHHLGRVAAPDGYPLRPAPARRPTCHQPSACDQSEAFSQKRASHGARELDHFVRLVFRVEGSR